jgi:hypothetical protein
VVRRPTARRGTWFAVLLLLAAGCGPGVGGRYPVAGTVTLDGQPLAMGTIEFEPRAEGAIKVGEAVHDGRYAVPARLGPTPGSYRVKVWWHRKTGRIIVVDGEKVEEYKKFAPDEYNGNTTLTAEVRAGENVFDFALKSAGGGSR